MVSLLLRNAVSDRDHNDPTSRFDSAILNNIIQQARELGSAHIIECNFVAVGRADNQDADTLVANAIDTIRAQLDPQDPRLNAATAGDSDVSLAYAACPKGCAIDIRNNDNTLLHSELQTFDGSPITSQAQYLGAIAAAKVADTFGLGSNYTFLFPDQLVLNQLTGQHAVKSAKLIPLHAELTKTLADFEGTKVLLTKDDTNGSRLTNLKRAAKTQTLQQIQ
jgi:hypothetical protein